ncbi:superoxide dismutase family protein [Spirillospora sp. NPDC029432]|uniref:superoxide dismutase family protein n=1 Tax=Spirillospora sp. NPDC029432 TaxID=3154599 RepID=UPI0034569246
MPTIRRTALTCAATGIALGVLAAPAAACPEPHGLKAKGPTHAYAKAYKKARTAVHVEYERGRTTVRFKVAGMPKSAKGKRFGVHVHRHKCGPRPADAGPHYQNPNAKPGTPLRDKEIWLDVKVDRKGRGASTAVVPWKVEKGTAGSVVLHAKPTNPRTGDAGDRLLCTTVPFGS